VLQQLLLRPQLRGAGRRCPGGADALRLVVIRRGPHAGLAVIDFDFGRLPMRAVICLSAVGVVLAAMCFGGARSREATKTATAAPAGKAAGGPAAKPALEAADKKSPAAKDESVNEKEPGLTDESETPDKYAADRGEILKSAVKFMDAFAEHDASAIAALFAPD